MQILYDSYTFHSTNRILLMIWCVLQTVLHPAVIHLSISKQRDTTHKYTKPQTAQTGRQDAVQFQNKIKVLWCNDKRSVFFRVSDTCCDCREAELFFFVYNEYLTFSLNNNNNKQNNNKEQRAQQKEGEALISLLWMLEWLSCA